MVMHGKPNALETLTPMQQRFVEHYLKEPSLVEAARAAGYAHPKAAGYQVMRKPHVRAEVQRRQAARAERLDIDEAWVLRELKELYDRFIQNVTPALNSKTGKPLRDDEGNPLYKFDGTNALAALKLIGAHIKVGAFQENVKVTTGEDMVERIHAGRKRARIALRKDQIEDADQPKRPVLPKPDPEVLAEFAATRKSKLKPQPE